MCLPKLQGQVSKETLLVFSWNIEGFSRGYSSLSLLASKFSPSLIFLSEPKAFLCDIDFFCKQLPSFKYHLNSEDVFCPDLPVETLRAKGGTMALWDSSLDPFISILDHSSSSSLPLLLDIPNINPSIHIGIYLPTGGHDDDWLIELSALTAIVEDALENYPDTPIYIRGDSNVNPKNINRMKMWTDFMSRFNLVSLNLGHPTYHHFLGDGKGDSQLDVLLTTSSSSETLVDILCSKDNDLIRSSHDLIISSFTSSPRTVSSSPITKAPRISLNRYKFIWDKAGTHHYTDILSHSLPKLIEEFGDNDEIDSFSTLIARTITAITNASRKSFKTIDLDRPTSNKKSISDPHVKHLSVQIFQLSKQIRKLSNKSDTTLSDELRTRRKQLSQKVLTSNKKIKSEAFPTKRRDG